MQLDIFDHSRDVMLRNDVLGALQGFDAAASRSAWRRLEQAYPADDAVAPMAALIDILEQCSGAPFANHGAVHDAARALTENIPPAARHLFDEGLARATRCATPETADVQMDDDLAIGQR